MILITANLRKKIEITGNSISIFVNREHGSQNTEKIQILNYVEKRSPAKTFEDMVVLTSQFRRAAISIAANIAEVFKKRGKKDKYRFLNIAQGSEEECLYFLILSRDLNYGSNSEFYKQCFQTS